MRHCVIWLGSLLLRHGHTVGSDDNACHPTKGGSSLRLLRIGGMTDWVAVILGLLLVAAVKFGLIAHVPW